MNETIQNLFSLAGRTALITGGSSGIGAAIAEALAKAGARVVLWARQEAPLREVATRLQAAGCEAGWTSADLGDRTALHRGLDDAVQPFGEPDIVVSAAGINLRPPLSQLSEADWDRTMAVNLDAPFLLGQRFGPAMARRGFGRIIHIASQQTLRAFGNSGAYGVSKAGIAALTRSQAEAWSRSGVRVNAIAPGFVSTRLTRGVFEDPALRDAMAARTMVGRNGEPADFAGVAILLAGPAADYLTGQIIFVDGGFSST